MMRLVSYQSSRLRCKLAVPCRVIDFLYREALATALLDGILEPPFTRAKTMSCCQSTYPPGMLFIGRKRPSVCALGNYVLFQFYPVGDRGLYWMELLLPRLQPPVCLYVRG